MTQFSGIVGLEIPKRFFDNFLSERDRMPHALLLQGPSGVGKFALSFSFARAFNCTGDGDVDCECLHCRQVNMGTFSDLLISSSMAEIKAEQMRQLTNEVVVTPRVSSHRIVIIDDFERVNETAANIFLKTLEEPPEHLRFILITSTPERLLPTIRSRCIPMDLKPTSKMDAVKALGEIYPGIDAAKIERVASTGRFGKAAREIHADLVLADKKDRDKTEPYIQLLTVFVDGLLDIQPKDYAFYLKSPLQTLLDSVEGRWKLKQKLPKGLDMSGLKRFINGELDNFTPVNYLITGDDTGKMREYDKARILVEDLMQMLYLLLSRTYSGDVNGLRSKLLHYIRTVRDIGRDLRGYRNIELAFEKILIGPDV